MQSWYFSEQSYYPAWTHTEVAPKISSPSSLVDPEIAHRLLQEYIEQCKLVDGLGMNIMANEHHATYTCMNVSCMMTLGIIASHTKNARLLALGIPVMSRMDPYRIAEEVAAGQLAPEAIGEGMVGRYMMTSDLPDPDLVIRTSGEQRLSNFLLWQSAYSEFVFLPLHWPEFDQSSLETALREFAARDRRFGGVPSVGASAKTGS